MADRNRNWGNQSNQDWDRNQGRYDRESYGGGTGNYGDDYNRNRGTQGGYGEAGYSGGAATGYSNRGWEESYGGGQYDGGYGNQYNRENAWNRRQGNWGSAGMYGGDFSREDDWRRSNVNTGNYGSAYGSQYGDYGGQRGRYQGGNIYGGDTSNYGNANQGGFDRDWWDKTRDEVSSWFGDDEAERRRRMDKQKAGQYRGKGPKGYTRSDERIHEDVCDRLSDDDYLDATDIDVKVENGEVILSGTVHDREQKHRAEDIVERISGVRDVENHIKVKREDTTAYTTSQVASDVAGTTAGTERNKDKNR